MEETKINDFYASAIIVARRVETIEQTGIEEEVSSAFMVLNSIHFVVTKKIDRLISIAERYKIEMVSFIEN